MQPCRDLEGQKSTTLKPMPVNQEILSIPSQWAEMVILGMERNLNTHQHAGGVQADAMKLHDR